MNDYRYEAFFSYKRSTLGDDWHFKLRDRIAHHTGLELGLGRDAEIFIDREDIRTGDRWKSRLESALVQSRCIVCIFSPNYFASKYCLSELKSFEKRSQEKGAEIVVAARSADGSNFPGTINTLQLGDFRKYYNTATLFWDSLQAVEFENIIREFSIDLADKIRQAPAFDPAFPVIIADDSELSNVAPHIPRPSDAPSDEDEPSDDK